MTIPIDVELQREFHLTSFRDHLSLEAGTSAHTIEAYQRDLRRLAEYAASKGIRDPKALTTQHLREFVFLLKDLGLSGATIRRNISAIHTWFGFLANEGLVERDPSERLETPKRWRTLPETLSVAEVTRLLETPNVDEKLAWRDRAMLELAYGAGLRVSELCDLGLGDLSSRKTSSVPSGRGRRSGWYRSAARSSRRCRSICTRFGRSWIAAPRRGACC